VRLTSRQRGRRSKRRTRAISAALVADREAAASALDEGRDDPGRAAEVAAREKLDEVERLLAVQEVRLTRARDALSAALTAALPGWTTTVGREIEKAEASVLAALDALAQAEAHRESARQQHAWMRVSEAGEKAPPLDRVVLTRSALVRNPVANPNETIPIVELIGAIREGVEAASLQAERDRVAEAEARVADEPCRHVASA
jgi:hypothetical protein